MMENFKQKLNHVKCFIFDVDGVLTNGNLIISNDGDYLRTMNIKDGYAIQLAVKKGYAVAVISGGKSDAVKKRMQSLGVKDVHMGVEFKLDLYTNLLVKYDLQNENVLYMGDDMPDLACMQLCGIPVCPYDATPQVKELSIYISRVKGGEGCVRDVIEQTMRLHGKWE